MTHLWLSVLNSWASGVSLLEVGVETFTSWETLLIHHLRTGCEQGQSEQGQETAAGWNRARPSRWNRTHGVAYCTTSVFQPNLTLHAILNRLPATAGHIGWFTCISWALPPDPTFCAVHPGPPVWVEGVVPSSVLTACWPIMSAYAATQSGVEL